MAQRTHGPLVIARNKDGAYSGNDALRYLWDEMFGQGCVGRCWGKRGRNSKSAIPGSNILLSDGEVIVVVCTKNGKEHSDIQLKVFGNSATSTLEARVRTKLVEAGLLAPAPP